jgi:hypothetical protein
MKRRRPADGAPQTFPSPPNLIQQEAADVATCGQAVR